MRLAISGTHRTGKSTLVEALAAHLPDHDTVDEPYHALEDDGHELSDPPTVEDFELQLRHSLASLAEPRRNAIFDRTPLDLVAYLQALDPDFDLDDLLDDLRTAVSSLDLIVFLPIEDRIAVAAHEDRRLRARVDDRLRTLLLDDPFDLGVRTLEVTGPLEHRLRTVLDVIRSASR